MAEIMQNATSVVWLVLAVVVFVRVLQWDKRFSDLYDDLKENNEEMSNNAE